MEFFALAVVVVPVALGVLSRFVDELASFGTAETDTDEGEGREAA